jgi:uncharacterized protein
VTERVDLLKLEGFEHQGYPVTLWDVFGEQGHPVRATVSDMGPLLLSRMLDLNETQRACSIWCSRWPTTTACCCST